MATPALALVPWLAPGGRGLVRPHVNEVTALISENHPGWQPGTWQGIAKNSNLWQRSERWGGERWQTGEQEGKNRSKKEVKHPPEKVYVGKQKKKRQNHSWENEHLPQPGQGCLAVASLNLHCLTRAPTSTRPVPGCILLPCCSPDLWEDRATDP